MPGGPFGSFGCRARPGDVRRANCDAHVVEHIRAGYHVDHGGALEAPRRRTRPADTRSIPGHFRIFRASFAFARRVAPVRAGVVYSGLYIYDLTYLWRSVSHASGRGALGVAPPSGVYVLHNVLEFSMHITLVSSSTVYISHVTRIRCSTLGGARRLTHMVQDY